MSNIKKYSLELQELDWTCTVRIDLDFTMKFYRQTDPRVTDKTIYDLLRDSYNFFHQEKDWYAIYAPDLVKPWLQMFAESCVAVCAGLSYTNPESVISQFAETEGYPPKDGSHGIKLVEVDPVEFTGHVWKIREVSS